MASQPEHCGSCGESVAVGSPFYSDRQLVVVRGARAYLCSLCAEQRTIGREGPRSGMTDDEREKLESSALFFGAVVANPH